MNLTFTLKIKRIALAATLALFASLLLACGSDDGGTALSREEVREIVRSEAPAAEPGLTRAEVEQVVQVAMAGMADESAGPTQADVEAAIAAAVAEAAASAITGEEIDAAIQQVLAAVPEPGITAGEVEELVRAMVAELPPRESALTEADVRRIAQHALAAIPTKEDPAEYTKFFVDSAIVKYEADGLAATLAHYNRRDSVDEQWYIFIFDEEGTLISHFNPNLIGENLNGPLGTDVAGYEFGTEMLAADETGRWVSYVYHNPGSENPGSGLYGAQQLKNAWVVRHDGLLFGSGWYINADDFTKQLVEVAVASYRLIGLEGTMAAFASPDSATAGLSETIDFYNNSPDVSGEWFAVIADGDGTIVANYDPSLVGRNLAEIYGEEILNASAEGNWVTELGTGSLSETEILRAWVVQQDGMIFSSGWHWGRRSNYQE